MNTLEQAIIQPKPGYKTSELWVLVAAGVAQALAIGFDPSKPLNSQLTNATWIALAYVVSRTVVKGVTAYGQAKVVAATVTPPAPAPVAAVPNGSNGSTASLESLARLDLLILLRDRGILSSTQYEEAKGQLTT